MGLIADTWRGVANAVYGESLLGVAEFIHRYGIADDFDKCLGESFHAIWHEYREAVRRAQYPSKARLLFCRILVGYYNKGLGVKSKRGLAWEA